MFLLDIFLAFSNTASIIQLYNTNSYSIYLTRIQTLLTTTTHTHTHTFNEKPGAMVIQQYFVLPVRMVKFQN